MSELKPGWRRVRLGEVADVVTDYWDRDSSRSERFVAGEHIDEGDLKIRRWGMTSDDLVPPTFNRRFRAGDVLFHSRNLRKVACPDFDGITGEKLFVLRAKDASCLHPSLLPFLLQTPLFSEYVNRMWAGSTNKFLNKAPLVKYEFVLPPLEVQRRLANALRATTDVGDALRSAAAAGDVVRASLIVRLYSRGIRSEPLKSESIGLVPKSWSVEPLGRRYSVQLGKMVSEAARSGAASGCLTPYLRNANVQWNRLDLDEVAVMTFTELEREKFSLRVGDILACEGRHVGKSAIWRGEIPGACYQKALHRLRAIKGDVPEFLLHGLRFLSITGRFAALTGETTIPHLPAEKLRTIEIAFPSIGEQREIAQAIDCFDDGLHAVNQRAERAAAIRAAFERATA